MVEKLCFSCGASLGEETVCPSCKAPETLESYGLSIKPAKKGTGSLLYQGNDPVKMVRESMKWQKEVSEQYSIPVELIEKAILNMKNGAFIDDNANDDEGNTGSIIVELTQANSENTFKDQLEDTYITYIKKVGNMGVTGMKNPIVSPFDKYIIYNIDKKNIYPLYSKQL